METKAIDYTPYLLFFFGIIITYIGWTTKKILENIEKSLHNNTTRLDRHDQVISELDAVQRLHGQRIKLVERDVVEIRKWSKI